MRAWRARTFWRASQSAAEYQSLLREGVKVAEAEEGLGLLALAGHRNDEARRHFAASIEASSASARCYIEYAKLGARRRQGHAGAAARRRHQSQAR